MRELAAKFLLLPALAFAPLSSPTQDLGPDALLRAVTAEVTGALKQEQGFQPPDPAKIAGVVESRVVPLFDFTRMTRLAMARNWRLATPEQQAMVTAEFKTLLVRTYSSALAQYRGEVISFKQLRAVPFADDVTVRSEVEQAGKERVIVDYHMEKTPAGWRIYDVKVGGVRLVTTYRDVFAEKIREGGVDGLLKFLADGNRGIRSRFNSVKNSFWEKSRIMFAVFRDIVTTSRQ